MAVGAIGRLICNWTDLPFHGDALDRNRACSSAIQWQSVRCSTRSPMQGRHYAGT